jgi:ABC-type transport system involved in multi-copper enzyme maturation permease subunit
MLKIIIKKEVLEAILSFRFVVATLLCLVLVPLGMYVNMKDYQRRLADYEESIRLYVQRSEGNLSADFMAEGFRPPSLLSIFSVGLEYFLPNKFVTSPQGDTRMSNEGGINDPESLLFGKVDLLFNVSVVLSLLALIFTFSSITGEKEDGTLRLMVSNPVPRWHILLGKLVGNYVVMVLPFLLSLLVSLILLASPGIVPVFSAQLIAPFVVILLVTLLFILAMFNLGMIVSALTYRSTTSIVTLLFGPYLSCQFPRSAPCLQRSSARSGPSR